MIETTVTIEQMFVYVNEKLTEAESFDGASEESWRLLMQVDTMLEFIFCAVGYQDKKVLYRGVQVPERWTRYLERIRRKQNNYYGFGHSDKLCSDLDCDCHRLKSDRVLTPFPMDRGNPYCCNKCAVEKKSV